jgi:hypothetical protein
MIPIVVVWTNYTAWRNGRVLKLVLCENCSTEYVYVLEREGTGTGTSVYFLNDDGARDHAMSAADDSLRDYLQNDFDPIPCPACGHYQKFMFPKLMSHPVWIGFAKAALLLVGGLALVSVLYWGVSYAQRPDDHALWRLAGTAAGVVVAGLLVGSLSAIERARVRSFDPNTEDQQTRIAKGKERAVPRAEFEAMQRQAT